MAGISSFRGQIKFVLDTIPSWRCDADLENIEDVLKGIWAQTVEDPDLGAKVGEEILNSPQAERQYKDHYAFLFKLVLRGWAGTKDLVLEENLARLIHSTRFSPHSREKIAEVFSVFLKERTDHMKEERRKVLGARTINEQELMLKLSRFIESSGGATQSPSIKVAANAYLRLAELIEIRSLFVR